MAQLSYRIAFLLVAASLAAAYLMAAASWLGVGNRILSALSTPIGLFGSPIPVLLAAWVPWPLRVLLSWILLALLVRRSWLSVRNRSLVAPSSFSTWQGRLLVVSVASLGLMILALVVSVLIKAGSGVPAALVGIPAFLMLTPTLFYVEATSLLRLGMKEQKAALPQILR
ncbi:MAG: hypothetical protein QM702_09215 [Rubrivivax sp.]